MSIPAKIPQVTVEKILERTREVGGCLEWAGHSSGGKYPQIRVEGKLFAVRRLIWQVLRGATRSDLWISTKCNNPLCVNPDHLKAHTRSKAMQGAVRSPTNSAKISIARRSKSVLTMEMVREMRSSDEPNPVLAERYGISAGYVSHIRRGSVWKEYVTPFAGLGAR